MAADPHLNSFTPRIISPKHLTHNSGTAEILRMSEVVAVLSSDFVVLPCDFVTDMDGTTLVELFLSLSPENPLRGGMGLWYQATGTSALKGEEPDFIATTQLANTKLGRRSNDGLTYSRLVVAMPADALNDVLDEGAGLRIRKSLIQANPALKLLRSCRDAHVYFLPHWILNFIALNKSIDSISEDVIGLWAKASWQPSLAAQLGFEDLSKTECSEIDIELAGLLQGSDSEPNDNGSNIILAPPIIAAIQSSVGGTTPIIRRVDTPTLLLSISRQIARLPTQDEASGTINPLAHAVRITSPKMVAPRCTTGKLDSLLAHQVDMQEKSMIKDSVIGPGVVIGPSGRISGCVVMEGSNIGPGCSLEDTVVGRRCNIGPRCRLKDCVIQDRYTMAPETEAKDQTFSTGAGLEEWPDEPELSDDDT